MIFRYPGGKSRKSVSQKILSYFPKEYDEYRETMIGGGGIFFNIPLSIKRWINDKDDYLMSVYLALRDRPKEFIASCRAILPPTKNEPLTYSKIGGKPLYNARLKDVFDSFAKNEEMDQALRYLFINRTVWAGRVNYALDSRMYYSNPNGWRIVHTSKMDQSAERLQNVKITCGDYEPLLTTEGTNVVIYIDPPYYINTNMNNNSRLYKHNFELSDHFKLNELISQTKHKIILSYDDNSFIRKLYKNFNINLENWKYCGTSSADGQSKQKELGKELVITNF